MERCVYKHVYNFLLKGLLNKLENIGIQWSLLLWIKKLSYRQKTTSGYRKRTF